MSTSRRSRSESFDGDDGASDLGDGPATLGDDSAGQAPGKPGRKKNPNTAAARRDQNRIAQREFRLRKQQKIRDLEAKVELLSGSKEDTFVQLRAILQDVMGENQTLRRLVRDLSGFIGEGMGGFLPKMGWDMPSFQEFVSRAETDTAFEAFTARKKANQQAAEAIASVGQKRRATEDSNSLRKKTRTSDNGQGDQNGDSGFSFANRSPTGYNSSNGISFSPILPFGTNQGSSQSVFLPPASSLPFSATRHSEPSNSSANNLFPPPSQFQPPFAPLPSPQPLHNHNLPTLIQAMPFLPGLVAPQSSQQQSSSTRPSSSAESSTAAASTAAAAAAAQDKETALEMTGKKGEAAKLILYHLSNYKRNPSYCLPPSLRPTLVQRTVSHDSIIDGVIYPELRDRLILLKGRYDLADAVHSFYKQATVHGDDVIAHTNWELDEDWLRRFGFLVDQAILSATNRWRRERGEVEIQLSDIASSEIIPSFEENAPSS